MRKAKKLPRIRHYRLTVQSSQNGKTWTERAWNLYAISDRLAHVKAIRVLDGLIGKPDCGFFCGVQLKLQ